MNELEKAQLAVEQANQAVLSASETIQKLVAENAELKQSEIEFDRMCAEEYGPDWVSEMTETPATDAAISEIKAQGGIDALESLAGVAETMVVSAENANWEQGAFGWSRVKQEATKAAANLRTGRKG